MRQDILKTYGYRPSNIRLDRDEKRKYIKNSIKKVAGGAMVLHVSELLGVLKIKKIMKWRYNN
jgi:hypothetical protein